MAKANQETVIPDDSIPIETPSYMRFGKIIGWLFYAWIVFGTVMLSFRVFLAATNANSTAGFYEFVHRTSSDFMEPFRGLFTPRPLGDGGYLDVAAIFAIIIYLILAWLVSAFIKYIQSKIDDIDEKESERIERLRAKEQKNTDQLAVNITSDQSGAPIVASVSTQPRNTRKVQ